MLGMHKIIKNEHFYNSPMPSTAHAVYFWFSLTFLITRTLALSLYSSAVHDQSKIPLQIFRACPSDSWCLEVKREITFHSYEQEIIVKCVHQVKRFCEEVNTDVVALSGMKFFYLTRKLVLSVAGTIITYELVLIQFHNISDTPTNGC